MVHFVIPINPVPYLRMTQAEVRLMRIPRARVSANYLKKWDGINRYLRYKESVQALARGQIGSLDLSRKLWMDCFFYFADGRHGDPDNCWKAIADALFQNDNKVCGSFNFSTGNSDPRTTVIIWHEVVEIQK